MIKIKLYIKGVIDNTIALSVLGEWAKIEKIGPSTTIELPEGTEMVAHDKEENVIGMISYDIMTMSYRLPCGLTFTHIAGTSGEYGTYHTNDKIEIHTNTI